MYVIIPSLECNGICQLANPLPSAELCKRSHLVSIASISFCLCNLTIQSDTWLNFLVRLLAMPLPTVMFYFGIVHLTLDILRAQGYQAPFRISSTPKGSVMPTALYVLIEDIVAVDGAGGQKYRRALRNRYLASPYFRQMLFEMNCFWGGGSIIFATVTTILIFTTPRDVAYVVSSTCRLLNCPKITR